MAEYIDREALFKRLKEETHDYDAVGKYKEGIIKGLNIAKSIVNDKARTPTADVFEVVRCKDCKHFLLGRLACIHPYHNGWCNFNAFCSYGERRCDNDS